MRVATFNQRYTDAHLELTVQSEGESLCFTYFVSREFRGAVRVAIGDVNIPLL